MLVFASLLAALMTAGAYISIPMGPVPIVLQNMFVFLAGLLLGSRWGLASVGVYLLAGGPYNAADSSHPAGENRQPAGTGQKIYADAGQSPSASQ